MSRIAHGALSTRASTSSSVTSITSFSRACGTTRRVHRLTWRAMAANGIKEARRRLDTMALQGPADLNDEFMRSVPDAGPVVMVNLVRFREQSRDGDGSGWEAYLRYSKADIPLLKRVGGTICGSATSRESQWVMSVTVAEHIDATAV